MSSPSSAQELARIGMPDAIAMRHRAPHFQHIFSGGYSAAYYSYLWSEVLDADGFEAFEEAGDIFDPAVARRLHDFVYAAGGSRDYEAAYRGFRGRARSPAGAVPQARLRGRRRSETARKAKGGGKRPWIGFRKFAPEIFHDRHRRRRRVPARRPLADCAFERLSSWPGLSRPSTPRCRKDESGIGAVCCKDLQTQGVFPSAGLLAALGASNHDRGREGFRLPSLRTVRAIFPHTALQSLVSSSGMSRVVTGCGEGEQSLIREEDIGPALMVVWTATEPWPLFLLAQDRPQPSPDEAVQKTELGWHGVFEVTEPSPQHRVELADDPAQAYAPAPSRLGAHLVLERLQAFLAHEPMPGLEPIAKEVEPLTRLQAVPDPRLVRMQREAVVRDPRLDLAQCGFASSAVRHKITKSSA